MARFLGRGAIVVFFVVFVALASHPIALTVLVVVACESVATWRPTVPDPGLGGPASALDVVMGVFSWRFEITIAMTVLVVSEGPDSNGHGFLAALTAGVIVLEATQKPSVNIVSTALWDVFGFRWALRCSTSQALDTIPGSGWASLGHSAAVIDSSSGGWGTGSTREESRCGSGPFA